LPKDTPCDSESKTVEAISKARTKLTNAIGKACGGKDKTCDTVNDVSLTDIGWLLPACPGFAGTDCTNATMDCAGVATCVTCIGEASVHQAIGLAYDDLVATNAKLKADKPLNKCQRAIGKAAAALLAAKADALARCWDAVNEGRTLGLCPNVHASDVIAKATAQKARVICKACGGNDRKCDGMDDYAAADIGFTKNCPDLAPPPNASCAATVSTIGELFSCLDCISDFHASCATVSAVPVFLAYPTECVP
jgi:hypothetical protein